MSNCNMATYIKPVIFGTIALAVLWFAAEFVIHGIWLMPLYEQTAELWRPSEEMGPSLWSMLRLLAISFAITVLYCKTLMPCAPKSDDSKKSCPMKHGLCFGAVLGLLIGTMMGSSWLWQPIPVDLAIKWFITGFAQGVLSGLVLAPICKIKG